MFDNIVQCLVSFAHLRLRSVRANVLPSVVDHLVEVEHLVVVVAVGGEVYLNNKVACIFPQSFIVLRQ